MAWSKNSLFPQASAPMSHQSVRPLPLTPNSLACITACSLYSCPDPQTAHSNEIWGEVIGMWPTKQIKTIHEVLGERLGLSRSTGNISLHPLTAIVSLLILSHVGRFIQKQPDTKLTIRPTSLLLSAHFPVSTVGTSQQIVTLIILWSNLPQIKHDTHMSLWEHIDMSIDCYNNSATFWPQEWCSLETHHRLTPCKSGPYYSPIHLFSMLTN